MSFKFIHLLIYAAKVYTQKYNKLMFIVYFCFFIYYVFKCETRGGYKLKDEICCIIQFCLFFHHFFFFYDEFQVQRSCKIQKRKKNRPIFESRRDSLTSLVVTFHRPFQKANLKPLVGPFEFRSDDFG